MKVKKNYVLGLDLGTNSIGWACISQDNDTFNGKKFISGVRIFDTAEVPKTGESLAKPRREARLGRHRLRHRRIRLNKIIDILIKYNFIKNKNEVQVIHKTIKPKDSKEKYENNIWILRVNALDKLLTNEDLVKIIYHISKHRGFQSSKKTNNTADNKDKNKNEEEKKANAAMLAIEE